MPIPCLPCRPIAGFGGLVTCLALGLWAETAPGIGFEPGLRPVFGQDSLPTSEAEALPDSKTVTVIVEEEWRVDVWGVSGVRCQVPGAGLWDANARWLIPNRFPSPFTLYPSPFIAQLTCQSGLL